MTTSTTTQDSYLLLGQTCIWSSTGSQVCMNSTRITSIHSLLFTPQKPCIGHDSVLQDYIVYFYLHHFARYLYPILQLYMNYVGDGVNSWRMPTPGACQLQVHVNSRHMSTPGVCQFQAHVNSRHMSTPGTCQLQVYVNSRHMSTPGACVALWII